MKKSNLTLLTSAIALSTFVVVSHAHAQSDNALLAIIANNTAATTTGTGTIASAVTTGSESIVQAILALQQQELALSSASQQVNANLAQVNDRQAIATAISQERLAAIKGSTSGYSSCNTIYAGVATQAFTPALLAWKEGLFTLDNDWLTNQQKINGKIVPSGASISLTTSASVAAHCANFAEQSDLDNHTCPQGTPLATNPGADLNMGHLFDQISMSTADASAAEAFLRLAVHPQPLPPLPPSVAGSGAGQQAILARQTIAARLSVAYSLMSIGLANRQPLTNAAALSDWAEGTAKDAGYTADPTTGKYFPNGVSLDAAQKLRADSWVQDGAFTQADATAPNDAPLIKDLIAVEAFRAQVDVENKFIQEQIAAGIGVLIANSVRTSDAQP